MGLMRGTEKTPLGARIATAAPKRQWLLFPIALVASLIGLFSFGRHAQFSAQGKFFIGSQKAAPGSAAPLEQDDPNAQIIWGVSAPTCSPGQWSVCTKSCGGGTQTRSFTCHSVGVQCPAAFPFLSEIAAHGPDPLYCYSELRYAQGTKNPGFASWCYLDDTYKERKDEGINTCSEFDDMCKCTGNGNGMECSVTGIRYCASDEECSGMEEVKFGDWSNICSKSVEPNPNEPQLPTYDFLFNGCCRGEATDWANKGNMAFADCGSICDADSGCNAIEQNGWNGDSVNGLGACYTFQGPIGGDITSGGCITSGDQKCFAKVPPRIPPPPSPQTQTCNTEACAAVNCEGYWGAFRLPPDVFVW
jgi:hypothetical protein